MVQVRTAQELTDLSRAIFVAAGATPENAEGVTSSLVSANLAGHDSHGVIRIPSYVEDIRKGRLLPAASPFVVRETAATAIVDGGTTFGQLGARLTAQTAAAKAREVGLAAACLFRGHHTGRIGEWAELGASQGLITMVAASAPWGPHQVAPFGGRTAVLGTNPIAWAVPQGGDKPPILLDFATSAAAQGKLMVARARAEPVPSGWIVDAEGNPTTDVEDFYAGGSLLPVAGHKGYALSVIVELLAVGLSGGEVVPPNERGSCLYIGCIDPGAFRAPDEFSGTVARTVERLKSAPTAAGFTEILMPGEPESRSRTERQQSGIPLPESTWEAITDVARTLGVTTR
jgi:LDH2 family malate/lactate/ureidoglycolate dehydrogenase